jgi:hypothetical protein
VPGRSRKLLLLLLLLLLLPPLGLQIGLIERIELAAWLRMRHAGGVGTAARFREGPRVVVHRRKRPARRLWPGRIKR